MRRKVARGMLPLSLCALLIFKLLNCEMFNFAQLPDMLRRHLSDVPPVSLPYTIRVDSAYHVGDKPVEPTIYDVTVPLEDPLQGQLRALASSPNYVPALHEIAAKDDELALQVQAMYHAKAKHGFFTAMSKDPANFVKRWVSSQKRDLDVILGAGSWGEEDFRSPEWRLGGAQGPWGSAEAVEGVGSYLTRQQPQVKS